MLERAGIVKGFKNVSDYGKFHSKGSSKMNPPVTTTQLQQTPARWEEQLNKQTHEQLAAYSH